MNLIFLSLAPVLIIAIYIYFRDKYEKEPIGLLIKSLVMGAIVVIPIIYVEKILHAYGEKFVGLESAAYTAFVVAACTEEFFKFIGVYLLVWKNKNFNEKFDGIVYATFVSLGFAAIENIMYVTEHGFNVGILRALTAVPAHAFFGIIMGYYLGKAKIGRKSKSINLFLALIVPIIFHGCYDFILMSQNQYLLLLFIPFLIYLWRTGFRRMRDHSKSSKFRYRKPRKKTN